MEKKAASGILLTLLLVIPLTLAFSIQPVEASGTIYIRADGSIDPSTASIQRDGDIYSFTADIYDSIVVERDNIVVDGNSHMIQGAIDYGFFLSERSNVTIKNTKITGFSFGITLYSSFNNTISNNTFVSNQWFGISIAGGSIVNPSNNNTIVDNSVSESACGIQVHGGGEYYNTIENNKIYSNIVGIQFSENARYNVVLGNSLSNNDYGFMIMGRPEEQQNSGNRIFHNNFVENTHQAVDSGADNVWDDGYPSGGNYWSDYSGVDLYHGANQDVPSRDGIGDAHYIIDPNKQDRYPLMDPWIERKVGVQVGDWVKYGNFVVEWSSDDPSANPPSDYDFWRSIEWTKTTVETISGTTITFEFLIHFKDDTEQSSIWDIDVDTGEGFPFYFISADLTVGYTTYAGGIGYSPGPKINETIFAEYLGTSRETNHLNLTRFYEDYFGWKNYKESYNLYWDRTTGVQTEYSYQRTFETGTEAYLTAQLTSFRIVDTNLWRERMVGVKIGDWAKCGVDTSWTGVLEPYLEMWSEMEWGMIEVTDVQSTVITFTGTAHFKNGSELTFPGAIWDVAPTGSFGFIFWFIGSDLQAGDRVYPSGIMTINETVKGTYCGVQREINHLNWSTSSALTPQPYDLNEFDCYWDKATGILAEECLVMSTEDLSSSFMIHIKMVDTNLWEAPTPPTIMASVDIDPGTLNLRSKGQWITAYIQLPEDYDPANINASTVLLNGTIPPVLDSKYGFVTNSSEYLVDHNNDGILERMVKFDRATVESLIYDQGIRHGDVALTLTGKLLDGTLFEGTDVVFVNYAGDVNDDGMINILDAAMISAHWYPGPPIGLLGYDANADLNNDGVINILDSGIISSNWGQTVPSTTL